MLGFLDSAVALEEVARLRARLREYESFVLARQERLELRVKLLEIDRAQRIMREALASEEAVTLVKERPKK